MSESAVVISDLVRTFRDGEVHALDGVSLEVPRGQVFGLLGPNGSGKTTMIRILSTVLSPTSGSATVNGFDVVARPDDVRRSIGLAGQYATVDENLTGFENLRMIGRLNHLEKPVVVRRSNELLGSFGLSDAAHRPARTYSGGMRRRLDLAAALVADPPLLFLDEPTTGLDPQSRQDMWGIIEGLVSDGSTVLLTTQYLEEADRLAKQLVVLDHGRIIAEGTSAELKARLGATVLSLTFADAAGAARGLELVRNLSSAPAYVDGARVELTIDSGPAAAAEALRRLDGDGVVLLGLELREPSLDDVFLNLTGHKAEDEVAEAAVGAGRGGAKDHS
ncbi:MAG: ATP-binding cassette domain-containing protein [Acidimicrobiales bacterium]